MPNINDQKPSLLSSGPNISDMPKITTMPLHCYHTLRDYHSLISSQEFNFRATQSIGTPLVALIMSSMRPFTPPIESITNGKLGPKLEYTWDNLPYTTMMLHWFSTATPA